MKILLTFLTIVLINFNAKASKMFSVGTLYEYCSLYKENNFKLKGLNPSDAIKSTICFSKITSYMEAGVDTCRTIGIIYRKLKKENTLKKSDEGLLDLLASTTGIRLVTKKQAILSFLNWAEKNPNKFNQLPFIHLSDYLITDFPCKINKKPPK